MNIQRRRRPNLFEKDSNYVSGPRRRWIDKEVRCRIVKKNINQYLNDLLKLKYNTEYRNPDTGEFNGCI